MDEQQCIASTLDQVAQHLKPASIAHLGQRPTPTPACSSHFGGNFFALPGEQWPESHGHPMTPLIQIVTSALTVVPPQLNGIALLNVFVDAEHLPWDMEECGDKWCIRTYPTLTRLVPLTAPSTSFTVHPQPIAWSHKEKDAMVWEQADELVDMQAFNTLPDSMERFSERFTPDPATKVGGWPAFIQSPYGNMEHYVFQVGTEIEANWTWGDDGNGYFFRDENGTWFLYWDCY